MYPASLTRVSASHAPPLLSLAALTWWHGYPLRPQRGVCVCVCMCAVRCEVVYAVYLMIVEKIVSTVKKREKIRTRACRPLVRCYISANVVTWQSSECVHVHVWCRVVSIVMHHEVFDAGCTTGDVAAWQWSSMKGGQCSGAISNWS